VLGGCPEASPSCVSGLQLAYICNPTSTTVPIALVAGQRVVLVLGSYDGAYLTSGQARVRYLPPVPPPECSAAPEMALDTWTGYANELLYPNVSTPCGVIQHAVYFSFTAPQAGQYQFDVQCGCSSGTYTRFGVLGGYRLRRSVSLLEGSLIQEIAGWALLV
jgi:hypothetical protein